MPARPRSLGHEGRAGGHAGAGERAGHEATGPEPAVRDLRWGGAAPVEQRPGEALRRLPVAARGTPCVDDGADRQPAPGGLPGQHQGRAGLRGGGRAFRQALAGAQRDPRGDTRPAGRGEPGATRRRPRRAEVPRGAQRDRDRGRDREQRDPRPGDLRPELPLCRLTLAGAGLGPAPGTGRRGRPADRRRQRPLGPGARGERALGPAPPGRRPSDGAQASLDTRGGVRRARPGRNKLRPRRSPDGAPARREDRGRRHEHFTGGLATLPVRLNPVLTEMRPYPFLALDEARQQALKAGLTLIDFSVGDPHESTDLAIRESLIAAVEERSRYPKAEGLPELKQAVADWWRRRYGGSVDPQAEVMPTFGSKEALFSLPFIAMDTHGPRRTVVVTEPGYPIPERAAQLAGAETRRLPLRESNGFLPDLDELTDAEWDRVAILYVNYPNNPTAAVATLSFYRGLAEKPERHGFLVASDEAYSEVYFTSPPASALQAADRSRIAVFNTQSKRSSMTGYRSGFLIGPPELIRGYRLWRPLAGVAVPEFIQRATIAALSREDHVDRMRGIYAAKRELFLEFFAHKGVRVAGSEATFYLWCEVPGGEDSQGFATRLLERGVVVAPGSFFGASGEGYFRVALVPTLEEGQRAVEILEDFL